jgi:hypothetical protein
MVKTNSSNRQPNSARFTPNIDELIRIVDYFDPIVVQIIDGVEKVLADKSNPDRYHQAANSIRHITGILTRNVSREQDLRHGENEQRHEVLRQFDDCFDRALDLMPVSESKSEMDAQRDKARAMFSGLKDTLEKGELTQRQKLCTYFGNGANVTKSPEFAVNQISKTITLWTDAHDYFIKLAHYGDGGTDEAEFLDNWHTICGCIVKTLSLFIHDRPALDEILKLEEPPDE